MEVQRGPFTRAASLLPYQWWWILAVSCQSEKPHLPTGDAFGALAVPIWSLAQASDTFQRWQWRCLCDFLQVLRAIKHADAEFLSREQLLAAAVVVHLSSHIQVSGHSDSMRCRLKRCTLRAMANG